MFCRIQTIPTRLRAIKQSIQQLLICWQIGMFTEPKTLNQSLDKYNYSLSTLLLLQVDNALSLIEIGISKHIPDLEGIHNTLSHLAAIVYKLGKDISLEEYEFMSEYQRLCLVLEDSTENTIHTDIKV